MVNKESIYFPICILLKFEKNAANSTNFMVIYIASLESQLCAGIARALVSSSTASPCSNTAAAPIPDPVHHQII
jgi:hypothetical protein